MKKNAISKLMTRHHKKLERLLRIFKANIGKNVEKMSESLERLRWEFEKHTFCEEKVMFKFCETENCTDVLKLIKAHDEMLEMLSTIKSDLAVKDSVDISGFLKLIGEHKNLEEKILYPKLDRQLDSEQKKFILRKIREVSYDGSGWNWQ